MWLLPHKIWKISFGEDTTVELDSFRSKVDAFKTTKQNTLEIEQKAIIERVVFQINLKEL